MASTTQTAVRLGVRNRLQTKRDALTFNWLELDTFFQVNPQQPHGNTAFVKREYDRCRTCSTSSRSVRCRG